MQACKVVWESLRLAVMKTASDLLSCPRLCENAVVPPEVKLELRAETARGYQSVLRYLEGKEKTRPEFGKCLLTFKRQDGPLDWNTPHLHRNRERAEPRRYHHRAHFPIWSVALRLTCIGPCCIDPAPTFTRFLPLGALLLPNAVLAMPKPGAEGAFLRKLGEVLLLVDLQS